MASVGRAEMAVIMKIHQRIDIPVRQKHYIRTASAVSSVRFAVTGVFIAVKAGAALPAVSCLDKDLCLVNKHLGRLTGNHYILNLDTGKLFAVALGPVRRFPAAVFERYCLFAFDLS